MQLEAIAKVQAEMAASANNPYVQVVGQFLIQHLNNHPDDAQKVLAQDKTVAKSLDAMRKEAEKKKVGNCAVLTDAEGFAVVLKYFGIEGPVAAVPLSNPVTPPVSHKSGFNVKLDDFL